MTSLSCNPLLFDLDGTLVDSLRDIAESMNEVLENSGYPSHPIEAYNRFVGDGMIRLAERVLPASVREDSEAVTACVQEMKEAYSRRWRDHSSPYPGIRDLLSTLSTNGNRLGVLSNKPEAFTREMVNHFFPDIPFATVRGAREGVPVKPDPSAALEIQREWGVSPASILYAGDTDTDMKTGRAAGFRTVGVSWGFRDREELTAAGAHAVLDHPSGFLTLLADPPQGFIH